MLPFPLSRSMVKKELPSDATGDALRRLRDDGADLSKPHEIAFYLGAPDEEAGMSIMTAAAEEGFEVSLNKDDAGSEWTCCCTRMVLPGYHEITQIEARLDALAGRFGGKADGWGAFPVS